MSYLRFFKVLTLPVQLVADAIYYVKNGGVVEQYVTDDNGVAVPVRFPGTSGEVEEAFFTVADTSWQVMHNKGFKPIVVVLDSTGEEINALVTHTSINDFYVNFAFPYTGSVLYY